MSDIGKKLKRLRESKNLSLRELAKLAHISHSFIADIESGRSNPSLNTLRSLAKALNVPLSEFINDSSDLTKNQPTTLTRKDKREIEKILAETEKALLESDGLMFNGEPASEEAIQSIIDAMRVGMELAKKRNKEKYTPKKYQKSDNKNP